MANQLISGQTTVAAAGTAVALHATATGRAVVVRALAGNAGKVFVGNDGVGDVTSANGFELSAGEQTPPILLADGKLSSLYVDAATNGDKVCWITLERDAI